MVQTTTRVGSIGKKYAIKTVDDFLNIKSRVITSNQVTVCTVWCHDYVTDRQTDRQADGRTDHLCR